MTVETPAVTSQEPAPAPELSLTEQMDALLAAAETLIVRVQARAKSRGAMGRPLFPSPAQFEQLRKAARAMDALADMDDNEDELRAEFARLVAEAQR